MPEQRDPARIDRVLGAIREQWVKEPDWRLGQLLTNAGASGTDLFYVEDDDLVTALGELFYWDELEGPALKQAWRNGVPTELDARRQQP